MPSSPSGRRSRRAQPTRRTRSERPQRTRPPPPSPRDRANPRPGPTARQRRRSCAQRPRAVAATSRRRATSPLPRYDPGRVTCRRGSRSPDRSDHPPRPPPARHQHTDLTREASYRREILKRTHRSCLATKTSVRRRRCGRDRSAQPGGAPAPASARACESRGVLARTAGRCDDGPRHHSLAAALACAR